MKIFKKNQIIIYVIALIIMTAGYLNYTTINDNKKALETSVKIGATDDMQVADIGDATLVNSDDVVSENEVSNNNNNNEVSNENTVSNSTENANLTSDDKTNDSEETVETSSENNDEYFTKSKLERDTMYSQMLETYEKVLNSTNSSETQKQSASQEIQKINETKNSIMICENLIKTKGFENNIIFVNNESISVVIGVSNEMKQEEVAQVQNIISREMKTEIDNIHITTK